MPHALFDPLQMHALRVKNRIVVAPMLTYAAHDGLVGDWHVMHLGRFAAGGAGLVIMEATAVEPVGRTTDRDTGLWADSFVEPLRRVASFVKSQGALAGIQLNHAGRKRKNLLPWETAAPGAPPPRMDLVGPSAIPHAAGFPLPREATTADIQHLIEAWGEAARRADAAGFDVLELHAAHGYQLHQFLSPFANRRCDGYGGSRLNRMRFVVEVVERVRQSWPTAKPLFVRLSCVDDVGWVIDDSVELARSLASRGVDVIDCSSGGLTSHVLEAAGVPYGYQVGYAERIRAQAKVMTMAVGLIVHADQANAIIREGRADLVALAREMLHNPNWPMDAAQKLGYLPGSVGVPRAYSHWLDKRAVNNPEIVLSTWRPGVPLGTSDS